MHRLTCRDGLRCLKPRRRIQQNFRSLSVMQNSMKITHFNSGVSTRTCLLRWQYLFHQTTNRFDLAACALQKSASSSHQFEKIPASVKVFSAEKAELQCSSRPNSLIDSSSDQSTHNECFSQLVSYIRKFANALFERSLGPLIQIFFFSKPINHVSLPERN